MRISDWSSDVCSSDLFTASPLNKNGLHWINVIARCAEALAISRDDLLLDAVNGSRIRPSGGPSEYSEGSWLAEFHSLMEALQTRLSAHRDMEGLFAYLVQSHLDLGTVGNLSHSYEPILSWFRAELPEWPTIFGQLPRAMICGDLVGGSDRKSVVWGKSVSVRVDLGGRRII